MEAQCTCPDYDDEGAAARCPQHADALRLYERENAKRAADLEDNLMDADEIISSLNATQCAMREALEAAEYWLEAERDNPGQAKPNDILRVIRAALGKVEA